jgi:GNAT superfamily N-acetyltransferase
MTAEIIRGNISNLREIVELNSRIFEGMYEKGPFSFEVYSDRLEDKQRYILLVKDGEKLVGDSIAFLRGDSLYVWVLGIAAPYRKKGLATRLMELNEELARSSELKSVTLKVQNVSSEMKQLLMKRVYTVESIDRSKTDSQYDAVHFRLNL